jgi:hypothetical protein
MTNFFVVADPNAYNSSLGEIEDASECAEDDIYDIVDSVVPKTDNPKLPALTFRVFAMGFFFSALISIVNTIFTFKSNNFVSHLEAIKLSLDS